ncbi:MAG: hypothetical protein M4579_001599 [Chaenotheca gracillima]|nr:MAG: hypothetical protein M4579_001599 [Chaenotheca gracillima]
MASHLAPPLMRQLLCQCPKASTRSNLISRVPRLGLRPTAPRSLSTASVSAATKASQSSLLALIRSQTVSPSRHRRIRKIKVPPPPPAPATKDPIAVLTSAHIQELDPTGARTQLFSKTNRERIVAGDIVLVRFKNGDPFSGLVLSIRRRGVDTSMLLRNQLTRVAVELWIKIYSPNVEGVELVRRKEKRARRARVYYFRKPKHDIGSVEGVVSQYLRQKAALGGATTGGSGSKRILTGPKGKGRR